MHPSGGDSLHDGMVGLAHRYLEGVLGTVTRSTVDTSDERPVFKNFPFDAVSEICRTPAQSDHLIVGIPIAEGIVGGMDEDQATALSDKFNRRLFGFLGPLSPVVVENHRLMRTLERIPVLPFGLVFFFVILFCGLLNGTETLVGIFKVLGRIRFGAPDPLDGFGLGGGFHFHGKAVRRLQGGMQGVGRTLPIVVVLSVYNEHWNLPGAEAGYCT